MHASCQYSAMAVVIRVAAACLLSMGVENMQPIPFLPMPNAPGKIVAVFPL
jgi:hypothetical protein